jgi:hypothetical protein
MTTLTDAQKDQVRAWLREGLQLAEIQGRLVAEQGLSLTYFELKLLVSDLNLVPKDRERTEAPRTLGAPPSPAPSGRSPGAAPPSASQPPPAGGTPPARGRVTIAVDQLTQPGAMVSGGVTFSDGKTGKWFVDELGRLSVAPSEPGYRPPAQDMQEFQTALERELTRAGF